MLNPIITEYIAADRTDEAHHRADHARDVQVRLHLPPEHGRNADRHALISIKSVTGA